MKKQRIEEGKHSVKFWDRYFFPVRNENFILRGSLSGPGLYYDYENADNKDWNKYAGIQLDLYRPHGRTIMVVFRYNQNLNVYEWTFYYHNIEYGARTYKKVGSVPGYVDESNIIRTPVGVVPDWKVNFVNWQQIRHELSYHQTTIKDFVTFSRFSKKHTRGNFYWGGNQAAQNKVAASKRYVKW